VRARARGRAAACGEQLDLCARAAAPDRVVELDDRDARARWLGTARERDVLERSRPAEIAARSASGVMRWQPIPRMWEGRRR
jgi:hypothetical protein